MTNDAHRDDTESSATQRSRPQVLAIGVVPRQHSSNTFVHRIPAHVRTNRRLPVEPIPEATQLDLFPFPIVVERLDPKSAIGSHTGVEQLFRVKLRPAEVPHLVFHDRHGWYCEVHGPHCEAVGLARTRGQG